MQDIKANLTDWGDYYEPYLDQIQYYCDNPSEKTIKFTNQIIRFLIENEVGSHEVWEYLEIQDI